MLEGALERGPLETFRLEDNYLLLAPVGVSWHRECTEATGLDIRAIARNGSYCLRLYKAL